MSMSDQDSHTDNGLKYRRILLKLSGEALLGKKSDGIDPTVLSAFALQVKQVMDVGVQLARRQQGEDV